MPFVLSRADKARLIRYFLTRHARSANPVRDALAMFDDVELCLRVNRDGDMAQVLRHCVELAIETHEEYTPSPLENILTDLGLFGHHEFTDPLLAEIKRQRSTPSAAPDSPFEQKLLYGSVVIADRERLRLALYEIENQATPQNVLHIWGPEKSGRSQIVELINYYCAQRDRQIICSVIAREENATLLTPRGIATSIATQLGIRADLPPPLTNGARDLVELVERVMGYVRQASMLAGGDPQRVWLVIDGFSARRLTEDNRAFLKLLAKRFAEITSVPQHVLILCEFDEDAPLSDGPGVKKYDMEPLQRRHVRQLLRELAEANDQLGTVSHEDFANKSVEILIPGGERVIHDLSELGPRLQLFVANMLQHWEDEVRRHIA